MKKDCLTTVFFLRDKIKCMDSLVKYFKILSGIFILMAFYCIGRVIVYYTHICIPPAILGLIFFSIALSYGLLKEKYIECACNFLIKNMALFIVPFMGGILLYKQVLITNWFVILIVIFVTTTLTIVLTGLFVEYGLKFLRLQKIRKKND